LSHNAIEQEPHSLEKKRFV